MALLRNTLHQIDALELLQQVEPASTRLVFMDPPVDTGASFTYAGEQPTADRLEFFRNLFAAAHAALAPDGALVLFAGRGTRARVVDELERAFGFDNLRNEIIWVDLPVAAGSPDRLRASHSTLHYYARSAQTPCYPIPLSRDELPKHYRYTEDTEDRRGPYRLLEVTQRYSQDRLAELEQSGQIEYSSSGRPRLKRYLDEDLERYRLTDVWKGIHRTMAERRHRFPGQLPLALMERLLHMTTLPGDTVVDPFCGSGTTLIAAERLQRRWIGGDISDVALTIAEDRIADAGGSIERATRTSTTAEKNLDALAPSEFELYALAKLGARPSRERSVDGEYTYIDAAGTVIRVGIECQTRLTDRWSDQLERIEATGRFDRIALVLGSALDAHRRADIERTEGLVIVEPADLFSIESPTDAWRVLGLKEHADG